MSEEIGQYSAVDMATAAAQGFRDGVASVRPASTVVVPEGYALVPVEPTQAMLDAKHDDGDDFAVDADEYYFRDRDAARSFAGYVYRRMLAAAPAQPAAHHTEQALDMVAPAQSEVQRLREALETLVEHFEYYMGDNECRPLENARAALSAQQSAHVSVPSGWVNGFPPVGELCEARIPHHTADGMKMLWSEVEVIAHAVIQGVVYSWVKEPGESGGFYAPMMLSFRALLAQRERGAQS